MSRPRITDFQKQKLLGILPLGCDRPTACKHIGVTPAQLAAELKRDPDFAKSVAHAESEIDLRHLGNLLKASLDEKNWRTSAWWLDRRARQQSADDRAFTPTLVAELLDELSIAITTEIDDPALQRRVIERLLDSLSRREQLADLTLPIDPIPPSDSTDPTPAGSTDAP